MDKIIESEIKMTVHRGSHLLRLSILPVTNFILWRLNHAEFGALEASVLLLELHLCKCLCSCLQEPLLKVAVGFLSQFFIIPDWGYYILALSTRCKSLEVNN